MRKSWLAVIAAFGWVGSAPVWAQQDLNFVAHQPAEAPSKTGPSKAAPAVPKTAEQEHEHDHAGHDHADHDHNGHAGSPQGHGAHEHGEHPGHSHAGHDHHGHDHGHSRCVFIPENYPDPFCYSLRGHWLEEWPHSHFSRQGTPLVHFFFTEPAFLDRDLFVDFVYSRTADGKEYELATELEWALTRRLGVVVEVPGVVLDPRDGDQESGIGDLVVAPRFVLADCDRFMASFNLEIATATGDDLRGIGAGETRLGPSFTGWLDFGNWWTGGFRIGTEVGLTSHDTEIVYDFALAKSILGLAVTAEADHDHAHEEGNHAPPGMTHFIAEFNGRTIVHGADDGRSTAELLFGINYTVSEHVSVRTGYQFPLHSPRDVEGRIIAGLIRHF